MTVNPCAPNAENVFKSAWIPAPADGSDPAIDSIITNLSYETCNYRCISLDDISPLSGTGSHTTPPVGGTIIPVDMTTLFLAGAFTNAFWILPTFGGIAGAALALFKIKRKHD